MNYGTNLQHERIHKLVKKRLKKYGEFKYNPTDNPNIKVRLAITLFDFNKRMFHDFYGQFSYYYLTEEKYNLFKEEFCSLHGYHARIHPNINGHLRVVINQKEFSTRIFKSLDDNMYLYFIDDESDDNKYIRNKVHCLPEHLKFLKINEEIVKNRKDDPLVEEWLKKVLESVEKIK